MSTAEPPRPDDRAAVRSDCGGEAPALTSRAARAADIRATERWGIPSFALMESAGRATADEVQRLLAGGAGERAVVLCGPGSNGGDGLVVARTLVNRGVQAAVVAVGGAAALERGGGDTARNLTLWRELGRPVFELHSDEASAELVARLATRREDELVVVDALFGTGLARPLEGPFRAAVEAANAAGARRVAVDVPSGLDADTGEVLGVAIRADVTVTFVAPKIGFTRGEGPAHAGRVLVAEIGIPVEFARDAAEEFPPRPPG